MINFVMLNVIKATQHFVTKGDNYLSSELTASLNPGVSTIVSFSFTPLSSISSSFFSKSTVFCILSVNQNNRAYSIYPDYSDREACANNVDPDQMPQMWHLIWEYTVCSSLFF